MEFVIDTIGQADLSTKEKLVQSDDDDPDITGKKTYSLEVRLRKDNFLFVNLLTNL